MEFLHFVYVQANSTDFHLQVQTIPNTHGGYMDIRIGLFIIITDYVYLYK